MSESIYNLVPREYVSYQEKKTIKNFLDTSKEHKPLSGSTFGCFGSTRPIGAGAIVKKSGALFGPREEDAQKLKESSKKEKSTEHFHYVDRRLPLVPDRAEKPVLGIRTNKNFITANAVQAILQVPRIVDKGEENFLEKEDYGKVPQYLREVKEEIRREKEMIDKYVKEQMGIEDTEPEQLDELSETERQALVDSLKKKWAAINQKYQLGTHLVILDTAGQVRRKEQLENALNQIEADIDRLQKPGPILIRR
jgi:hypothetical protein